MSKLNFHLRRRKVKKRFLFVLVSLVVLSSLVLSACAQATVAPTEAPTAVPATAVPTEMPTAVPPTEVPTPAPTAIPPTATLPTPSCPLMANPPVVKAGALGSPDNPLVITFVPSGDTGAITVAGNVIADCLASMTGLSFKIEVGTTFGASIEAMGGNKAQIGFLNTFSVLLAEQKYGVIPVIANLRKYATNSVDPDAALKGTMQPFYKAEFLTTATSGIKKLTDLKGKNFCFVDPNSTSGYIVPRILLKAAGVDPDTDITSINAGSHPNVAIGVYKGQCDAGVAYIDILTDTSANLVATYPDIATKVVAFMDSDKIPNDGVQVVKTLDPTIRKAVVDSLLAMEQDPGGAAILKKLYNIAGMQKIDATFYNDFAKILKAAGVDPATLVK
jgi:phosphonate transport system substrate-binding protein